MGSGEAIGVSAPVQRATVAAEPARAHPAALAGSSEAIGVAVPEQRGTVAAEPAHAHHPGVSA
eukprot:9017290-Alexandrium_andersonii.AAC.1